VPGKALAPSESISYNPVRVFLPRGAGSLVNGIFVMGVQAARQYFAQEADDEANL
jgi:hypothetical protein